jgi:hypothetical protein
MERKNMKPCPRCLIAYHETNGLTKIRYIPQFMELCRDCCDPGEVELREKEKEQFKEFIRKVRDEKNRKRSICENIILSKNLFS